MSLRIPRLAGCLIALLLLGGGPGSARATASPAGERLTSEAITAHAALQRALPPPEVASYAIDARYAPLAHIITAEEVATYYNRTEAPIEDLVLHLYLNAFRSGDTLWMREGGLGHRGFQYDPGAPGWIRVEQIRLEDGSALSVEAVDPDETLVRVDLLEAVPPGGSITVEISFTAQLPRVFARTGWADDGEFVMAGQWFPKFGVWEDGAWNAYPFHACSEFYADFGTYEVALTLPDDWHVGATGVAVDAPIDNGDGTATHWYKAEHVIDFAWSASPHFQTMTRTVDGIAVDLFHYPGARSAARRVMDATVETLALYGAWYGPYGKGLYPHLTVILVPSGAGGAGGMEYPTLFTVGALAPGGTPRCLKLLEAETVHELAHQWFQSVVATNEAEAPWLDEGFADYSTVRALDTLYDGALSECAGWQLSYLASRRWEYVLRPGTPMSGRAWDFGSDYSIATYSKPVVALTTLERRVGERAMLDFLRSYYDAYAFAHPYGQDLRQAMAESLGMEIADWFFEELVHGSGTLDADIVDLRADGVDLEREGDLCVPVEVRLATSEGETSPMWPCDGQEADLDVVEELRAVEIDPDRVALLDLNLVNNGDRRQADRAGWLGFAVRMLRVLQVLFGLGCS
ncbi:MAG: M1 family metallopeptidase [Anaerolineae bacterium]